MATTTFTVDVTFAVLISYPVGESQGWHQVDLANRLTSRLAKLLTEEFPNVGIMDYSVRA